MNTQETKSTVMMKTAKRMGIIVAACGAICLTAAATTVQGTLLTASDLATMRGGSCPCGAPSKTCSDQFKGGNAANQPCAGVGTNDNCPLVCDGTMSHTCNNSGDPDSGCKVIDKNGCPQTAYKCVAAPGNQVNVFFCQVDAGAKGGRCGQYSYCQ